MPIIAPHKRRALQLTRFALAEIVVHVQRAACNKASVPKFAAAGLAALAESHGDLVAE